MVNYDLVIAVKVKKGYELPHYIRLTEDEIEIIKTVLHITSIEDVVKSCINRRGYKKDGYYRYNGELHLLKDIK